MEFIWSIEIAPLQYVEPILIAEPVSTSAGFALSQTDRRMIEGFALAAIVALRLERAAE
jgi:hypothetical protein